MTASSKVINEVIDWARQSIKQINHAKGVKNDSFEDMKTLVFAGMLSYYGQEYIYDVYLAFLKTDFVEKDLSINALISKMYNLSSTDVNDLSSHCPGLFYDVIATKKEGSCYKFRRTVYISKDEVDAATLLRSMTHQMNHVINSIHNSVVLKKNIGMCSRMGISLDHFQTRTNFYLPLEEAFNKLQERDIVDGILRFSCCALKDAKISELLDNIGLSLKSVEDDNPIIEIVKPLYDNNAFNDTLVDRRISGKIGGIGQEFDSKIGKGAYKSFLNLCGIVANSDFSESKGAIDAAKQFVKMYNYEHYDD